MHLTCRFHKLPFLAQICRQQLFRHLQHCASVMVAFHYAHTDAAHSMLHFDLHLSDHVSHEPNPDQPEHTQSSIDAVHKAPQQLTQQIIQQIIQESRDQLGLVEQQLKALRAAYPEVMASIRTRQVAQEMLLAKEAHIHELKSSGEVHVGAQNWVKTCLVGTQHWPANLYC